MSRRELLLWWALTLVAGCFGGTYLVTGSKASYRPCRRCGRHVDIGFNAALMHNGLYHRGLASV